MLEMNIDKLDECYVVTKRYNGTTFYHGSYSTVYGGSPRGDSFQNARFAYIYKTKAEAETVRDSLNVNRKRIKYKIDLASKHFVSNFTMHFSLEMDKLIIKNSPLSHEDYKLTGSVLKPQDIFKSFVTRLNEEVTNNKVRASQLEDTQKKEIERTTLYYGSKISEKETAVIKLENFLKVLQTFDPNTLEQFKTKEDLTYETLFGK